MIKRVSCSSGSSSSIAGPPGVGLGGGMENGAVGVGSPGGEASEDVGSGEGGGVVLGGVDGAAIGKAESTEAKDI